VCQIFRARDFPVSGSGCLSVLFQPRYLESSARVYPVAFPDRAYRVLPGQMLRVPVIFAFCAIRVTLPYPSGPHDAHSRSVT